MVVTKKIKYYQIQAYLNNEPICLYCQYNIYVGLPNCHLSRMVWTKGNVDLFLKVFNFPINMQVSECHIQTHVHHHCTPKNLGYSVPGIWH